MTAPVDDHDDDRPPPPDLYAVDPTRDTAPPPATRNLEAERALLGAILTAPHIAPDLRHEIDGHDFYKPAHEIIWDAAHAVSDAGGTPEPIAVHAHLVNTGDAARVGGAPYLADLIGEAPLVAQAPFYAKAVRDAARLRAIDETGLRLRELARLARADGVDTALESATDAVEQAAARFGPRTAAHVRPRNIKEFLTQHDEDYDWIVPRLLERQDRVILTGAEGAGKSHLGRQVAVMCAAGLHPFYGTEIPPITVLVLDFENTARQLIRENGKLYAKARDRIDPDRLYIEERTQGVDVRDPEDRAWITAMVAAAKPDLLVTGPTYKMFNGDTDKEKESKPVVLFLDRLRADHGCAVWLEAHTGNEGSDHRKRPERPIGWSGWRRWPEFGIWLDKSGELRHWRGDRDEREWPTLLSRDGRWPFTASDDDIEQRWRAIQNARSMVGAYLSIRDLVDATGITKAKLERVIGKNQRHGLDWDNLNGPNPFLTEPEEEPEW